MPTKSRLVAKKHVLPRHQVVDKTRGTKSLFLVIVLLNNLSYLCNKSNRVDSSTREPMNLKFVNSSTHNLINSKQYVRFIILHNPQTRLA